MGCSWAAASCVQRAGAYGVATWIACLVSICDYVVIDIHHILIDKHIGEGKGREDRAPEEALVGCSISLSMAVNHGNTTSVCTA